MLNKFLAGVTCALIIVISGGVYAQNDAQKIAVIDIQSAILGSTYGQQQLESLNSDPEYAELLANMRSLQADIQALDKEAQAKSAEWNEARFATYNKQRQFKAADLQLTQQKVQAEQERVVNEVNAAMNDRALAALEQLIQDEGITLLLRANAVYHATAAHNLTAKLAAKLSEQQ